MLRMLLALGLGQAPQKRGLLLLLAAPPAQQLSCWLHASLSWKRAGPARVSLSAA